MSSHETKKSAKEAPMDDPGRILTAEFLNVANSKDLVSRLLRILKCLREDETIKPDSHKYSGLPALCHALTRTVNHKDKKVRLYTVAACMELFTIYAPHSPWNQAETLDIFQQTIPLLANIGHSLDCNKNAEYFRILQHLAEVKTAVLLVRLSIKNDDEEQQNDEFSSSSDASRSINKQALKVLAELFRTLLSSVRLGHPAELLEFCQKTVTACIEEFCESSTFLAIPILDALIVCIGPQTTNQQQIMDIKTAWSFKKKPFSTKKSYAKHSKGPPKTISVAQVEINKKKKAQAELALRRKQYELEQAAGKIIVHYLRGCVQRSNYLATRAKIQKLSTLQAKVRGILFRKKHGEILQHLKEYALFYRMWGNCLRLSQTIELELPDWGALKDQQAYIKQEDLFDEERKETDDRLTTSTEDAMHVMEEKVECVEEVYLPKLVKNTASTTTSLSETTHKIHLSGDVVKWLKTGDPRYREFFVRRMKQLSSGERSRILAKRLKGSKNLPIYETYLEQKSGFRILWTEQDEYVLVWYITKHDHVSRLMKLIDDSKNRSEKQLVAVHEKIDDLKTDETITNQEIVLDPLGNVPLKVYNVDTLDAIVKQDWTPALHLTDEERRIVETQGTILLLGRSGTGKTVCICNRMEYDRQLASAADFSQLFVARSPRLCTYVRRNIGEREGSEFVTFDALLLELEKVLPEVDGVRSSFPDECMMRFSTFKREICRNSSSAIDPLIVWTNIRSFLKGSMEAQYNGRCCVSREMYLSKKAFGKKRCRLTTEQRSMVYDIFEEYQELMEGTSAWDNCDRILAIINRLKFAQSSETNIVGYKWCQWSKLYVDEVQDYTQLEILLFFRLAGVENLFLAGDPAQNVTKGVEFRFEDIRSVGYHVANGPSKLVPQKTKIVNVNFRSHAGILNAASSILTQMFRYFKDSARQLGKDAGLFQGPRPGMIHGTSFEVLKVLLRDRLQGTVVLTHDENVSAIMEQLGGYELVYGIRRAKGLEFKSVIVLDFFSSLPDYLQKPWREMLLNRADNHSFHRDYPEIEGHLKLLYTAVTRCIDRLFFAETQSSVSGDAFLRFATNTQSVLNHSGSSIATRNKIGDIENMIMTQDEWLASGITNAEASEAEINIDNQHAQSLMEKALFCFRQADNEAFVKKAKVQLTSFALRYKLENGSFGNTAQMETEAAKVLEKLLKENLLLEANGLGKDIKRVLYRGRKSSDFLERYVLGIFEKK